ncbi:hypothetical protein GO279_04525 [Ralstonia solanacearum]|nr:hypothetical protein [Ralstonia solanacearum]
MAVRGHDRRLGRHGDEAVAVAARFDVGGAEQPGEVGAEVVGRLVLDRQGDELAVAGVEVLGEREALAGAELAYAALAEVAQVGALVGLHAQACGAAGALGIGKAIGAGGLERFERGQFAAGVAGAGLGGGGGQGLVVPRGDGHGVGADRAHLREALDGVLALGGVDAVEADVGLRAGGAFGVVVEDDDAVARLRVAVAPRVALLVLDAQRQAFLGQQAHDEVVVGLAVLAADRALGARLADGKLVVGDGVIGEEVFDDLQRGLVLVDEAVAAGVQAVEPGPDAQAVARQPAVAAEGRAVGHVAVPGAAAAVGEHQAQRGLLRSQLGGIQAGQGAQAIDLQHARCRHRLARREAFHHQVVGGQRRLQRDLAGLLPEQRAQDGLRHGGRQGER